MRPRVAEPNFIIVVFEPFVLPVLPVLAVPDAPYIADLGSPKSPTDRHPINPMRTAAYPR